MPTSRPPWARCTPGWACRIRSGLCRHIDPFLDGPFVNGAMGQWGNEAMGGNEAMEMRFSLRCHLCHTVFPAGPLWVCDKCLGPLEVAFDYDAIRPLMSRATIESR